MVMVPMLPTSPNVYSTRSRRFFSVKLFSVAIVPMEKENSTMKRIFNHRSKVTCPPAPAKLSKCNRRSGNQPHPIRPYRARYTYARIGRRGCRTQPDHCNGGRRARCHKFPLVRLRPVQSFQVQPCPEPVHAHPYGVKLGVEFGVSIGHTFGQTQQ